MITLTRSSERIFNPMHCTGFLVYDMTGYTNTELGNYQNNRTKYFFFNQRKVDNSNKWKNYVIVTRVKLSVKLDALVVQSIFI